MLIPYKFLIPLLVFTLLIGVVIGDRLAEDSQGDDGGGRSGGCSGLASARLHACVHRLGSWRPEREGPRSGSGTAAYPDCWSQSQRPGDWGCGPRRGVQGDED
ncbi:MAG TPA: hypothetical protein VH913_08760 [Hyphomicrobiaceae bacterium]